MWVPKNLGPLYRSLLAVSLVCGTVVLQSCSDGGEASSSKLVASSGQITPAAYKVSYYAAARFADQATFGATPKLIEEIRTKGFEQWIDEQFALPYTKIPEGPTKVRNRAIPAVPEVWNFPIATWMNQTLTEPDQLRRRTVWSISNFLVASLSTGDPFGHVAWLNLLHQHSFGSYRELLTQASISPHMGFFLNNDQNRPKSAECPHCAPNENFARELMQLFSVGVVKLNLDGTLQRDARGRAVETYSQTDVEELARVLTGWTRTYDPADPNGNNGTGWDTPMVPSKWAPERDSGQKKVLGRTFAAGQAAPKDLDDAIDLLITHPNTAPFISTRLIQHLVKSNPSPEYVSRIARVFQDNGRGELGDLKAVVKAILLDSEARRGDDPARAQTMDGKFREPFLQHMAFVRGMGCQRNFKQRDGGEAIPYRQRPFGPGSVFGFYAPTDRAPGSNLLAPEQKLLNANEFVGRYGDPNYLLSGISGTNAQVAAGCNLAEFSNAMAQSSTAYIELVSARYFRGAMPPSLRSTLDQLNAEARGSGNFDAGNWSMVMLGFALATPSFGVMK
jgi:uncharacterized protein (DUF1800 family)